MFSQMSKSANSKAHIQWLDALRFLAAITVVTSHVRGQIFVEFGALEDTSRNLATALFFAVTRLGHEAVIVFFVLSGYFVGGKAFEAIRSGRFDINVYIIDRATRLWVPLVPVLIISCIGTLITTEVVVNFFGNVLGLQTVIVPVFSGNGPLWSLAYEQWFYIVPITIALLSAGTLGRIIALVLGAAVAAVFLALQMHYLLIWLIGAATWSLRMHSSWRGNLWIGSALIAFSCGVLQLQSDGVLSVLPANELVRITFEIALALGTALLIAPLSSLKSNWLSLSLSLMAASSYTLYLAHYPFLFFVMRFLEVEASVNLASLFKFFVVTVLCIIYSIIQYNLFEKHTPIVRRIIKERLLK